MTDLLRGPLRDYELKRRRAMHHFQDLKDSVQRFTDRDRKPTLGELDRNTFKYLFDVPLEKVDPDWALVLGDFVYARRASLDYLITALVRAAGNEEHERSQFPIYGIDRLHWKEIDQWWETDPRGTIEGNLRGTPTGTKAALKPLQPFYGVPMIDPSRHPLFQLQAMSNRDKHRRLNLLARNAGMTFVDAGGKPIFDGPPVVEVRIPEAQEGDTYSVTINAGSDLGVDVYLVATYNVVLNEAPVLIKGLTETLTRINQFIDARVVPTVKRLMR